MSNPDFPKVQFVTITEDHEGQRIDNYLRTQLKGVPKSMIYRILRKGEVRVNKKRVKPEYKLVDGDLVRVPPVRVSAQEAPVSTKLDKVATLESHILFEDEGLIVLNKPSGLAVHGGSGLSFGAIEALRALRPDQKFMELVHRLDRDTSGCLMIAKKRSVLKHLHEQLRDKKVKKLYWALVEGHWSKNCHKVTAPLHKNTLQSGERMVRVSKEGKPSETRYRVLKDYSQATLVEAFPVTGRTHQIRVHCQYAGHAIAGDNKYGNDDFAQGLKPLGLTRLCLHAYSLSVVNPSTQQKLSIEAPVSEDYQSLLQNLTAST